MKDQINQLQPNNISSDVYIITPAQLDYIASVFSQNFADTMNMRTFTTRINQIAHDSLRAALRAAKKMGEQH